MYKLSYNRGLWLLQIEALLEICVIDTDTQYYVNRTMDAVLASAEQEKKKYSETVEASCVSFIPFITSVDGALRCEANVILKRIGKRLSFKCNKSYSEVMYRI